MLAEEVFLVKDFGDRASFGICGERLQSHGSDFFHQDGVVSSVGGSGTPTKRGMPGNKNARNVQRILFADASNNGQASI